MLRTLHAIAATVHLAVGGAMTGLVINNPGNKWPIVNRKWLNESSIRNYELSYLLPAFPFLSAMNHIVTLADSNLYSQIIEKKVNILRWSEYAFSAGIMLWIICSLSGVIETRSLISILLLNAGLQFLGYQIEQAKAENLPKSKIRELILTAWCIHIAMWIQIFISFFTIVSNDSVGAPSAVYSIVFILFVLFSLFGLLTTLWAYDIITDFVKYEIGFIILSLTAKVFLAFMVFFGVLRAEPNK